MAIDKKVLNVPHLRFPEFTERWDTYRIADILCIGNGRDYKHLSKGDIPVFGTGGYMTSVNECLYEGETTFIGRKGTINKPFYYNGKFWTVDTLFYTHSFKRVIPKFVYCLFQTINWLRYNEASGVPSLSKDTIEKIKVRIPQLDEQKKIAKLLSLLDERIATQNKIIEDLKLLRDAISDAMFCSPKQSAPRKRIKGFYTDWQKVHLNDICSRVTRKNTNGRCYSVLTIAAQYGLVSQLEFFNKSVASENLEGYYLLQKGDFAYNKSYSSEYTCGAVKRLDRYEEGVLSPLYICFRPDPSKVDSDYLAYYFESKKWHREIMDISVEGARNHGLLNISVIDYFNTIHRIPNIEEQRAIAKVIKTIIHKMSSEQTILDCYVKQRTFLLQQMFI
ncbi:restriction endonuclease subunit S [Bacteroides ovatus]|uniref:restriction endonuclease subunit S n=1 Tax=Bacteroides ovatus TaxID=28116 RepID=UPI001F2D0871|nr:restriction endonuclease subunit S [Bacteroides ovatus]